MLYSLGLTLYLIVVSPFYLYKIIRGKYKSNFKERLGGRIKRIENKCVWLHACSVGEVEAAAPFVEILMKERACCKLIISTVTETGYIRAKKLYPDCIIRFLPFDFLFAIRRHFDSVKSIEEFYIIETEIWPNLIKELNRKKIPVFIVNGRISDRAWKRYRTFAFLFRPILALVTAVSARTATDQERFTYLGAKKVLTAGNIKYDRKEPDPPKNLPSGRFVIFGSTHPGEEEICINVFEKLRKEISVLRAIIAPRHIERSRELEQKFGGSLRSRGWDNSRLLILDTHGELAGLYSIADAAFIGGSMVKIGGHNPLEAAVYGVPVIWGPYVDNFREDCELLKSKGGFEVKDEEEMKNVFLKLLKDDRYRRNEGEKAREVVLSNRGAARRTWEYFKKINAEIYL